MTSCEFPRLQLRGSAGFSPASQFQSVWTEMREPKFFKERKSVFGIYLGCGGKSTMVPMKGRQWLTLSFECARVTGDAQPFSIQVDPGVRESPIVIKRFSFVSSLRVIDPCNHGDIVVQEDAFITVCHKGWS